MYSLKSNSPLVTLTTRVLLWRTLIEPLTLYLANTALMPGAKFALSSLLTKAMIFPSLRLVWFILNR